MAEIYWTFKDGLAVMDGIIKKGRLITISEEFQKQVLEQPHSNHMGIKKAISA